MDANHDPDDAIKQTSISVSSAQLAKTRLSHIFLTTLLALITGVAGFFLGKYQVDMPALFISRSVVSSPSPRPIPQWVEMKSKRVPLTFEYPSAWPITFEPDNQFIIDNQFFDWKNVGEHLDEENIDFDREWNRSAGGNRLGYIAVFRQAGIQTLADYVKYVDVPSELYSKGTVVKIPRPKIVYSKVGTEDAVTVVDTSGGAFLDSPNVNLNFIVVKEGLIYQIAATKSDVFMQDEEKNTALFKQMLATMRFE